MKARIYVTCLFTSIKVNRSDSVQFHTQPLAAFDRVAVMSALPPKADIAEYDWDVRFVPKADVRL
jgi:hypothetical protein